MTVEGDKSYVLFPLGKQRFALPAETVTELARRRAWMVSHLSNPDGHCGTSTAPMKIKTLAKVWGKP